ncbi:hypothetical protein [Actinocorallia longicatena]|uniref:Transcriptional regulator n=1 Tax=Actinocorallia longicatena TaxID=111803 RepID=A0ABP6Q0L4_9ACTN
MSELRTALVGLARDKATGNVRVGHEGVVHLVAGAAVFAECVFVPGLGRMLSSSGRLREADWRAVQASGSAEDFLGRAELEGYGLIALFDAAYYLLGSDAPVEFSEGDPFWLAPLRGVPIETLYYETGRRRERLDQAWPSAVLDDAPVVPVRRVRRQRVMLTGLQAELLLNADGRLDAAGLARELGHTRYGCTLAVRGLAASGLVAVPPGSARRRIGGAPRGRPDRADGSPGPQKWAEVDQSLLLRLTDALRELE